MAPSTSMPTARISENRTTMLMVSPSALSTRIPARNEPGMAMPTSAAERTPRAATTTIITSSTANTTEFCRSPSMVRMSSDLSWMKAACTASRRPSGQPARSSATTVRTASTVAMRFWPDRLVTSSASAGRPSMRAKPSGSLNVRRTSAMSRSRTTVSPSTFTGRSMMSLAVSNSPGTLIENRPWPVSWAPAATSRLLSRTMVKASAGASP